MSLSSSLSSHEPNYLSSRSCGFCLELGTLEPWGEYPCVISNSNPEVAFTNLQICRVCTAIYNPTTEELGIPNRTGQTQWLDDIGLYKVPRGRKFLRSLRDHSNILDFIFSAKQINPAALTLFEFGAGTGMLSAAATGHFSKVLVHDLTDHRLQEMRERLGKPNLFIVGDDGLDTINPDFVVAWHVFEHLVSPGQVFNEVLNTLPPNGMLYFQVPLLSREFVYPNHIFFLNEYAIRQVCEGKAVDLSFYYDHSLAVLTCFIQKVPQ